MVPNTYSVILDCQRDYQERLREPRPSRATADDYRDTPAVPARLTIVPDLAGGWLMVRQLITATMRQLAGRSPLDIDPGPAESSLTL